MNNFIPLCFIAKTISDNVFHCDYYQIQELDQIMSLKRKDTMFSYYIDIYKMDHINEWESHKELPYLKTCCGQTILKDRMFSLHHDTYFWGNTILEKLTEVRQSDNKCTTLHPKQEMLRYKTKLSLEEYEEQRERWEKESVPLLDKSPRTYFDMVVVTPARLNFRILFKFIEGFKAQVMYQVIPIDKRKKCVKTPESSLDIYSYKDLFEIYDMDNTETFQYRLEKGWTMVMTERGWRMESDKKLDLIFCEFIPNSVIVPCTMKT